MERMQGRNLQGKVERLGVVAHGDEPGVVQLDRRLRKAALASFDKELERLRWFLVKDAMVIFYSCIAGKAVEGDEFLNALSGKLPGRTIVGFTMYGETSARGGLSQAPGEVFARESALASANRQGPYAKLNPWHPAGKWSQDGQIVRRPPLERRTGNRCANPKCPGHRSQLDHCAAWNR